ncbi:hypothetical protein WA577_005106, partial [Blastocystis sp. JDR]
MQFNVNWKGIPTYQDVLSNVYTYSSKCGNRTYTALYHTPLNCTSLEDGKFDCVGNVESVWVRIWEAEQWQTIITHCGAKFGEKYQDVTKNPCVINGDDQFKYLKQSIGLKSTVSVTIKNGVPEEFEDFHYAGKCVWVYEVEGFWSTLVITIFTIAITICLILVIALYIYANKHRAEKRTNQLNRSLVNEEKQ